MMPAEFKILIGHVLDILPDLPIDLVDCCVTSPPYWGLRDYGVEPLIWDGKKLHWDDCAHEWSEELGRIFSSKPAFGAPQDMDVSKGYFCKHCGGWLGSLGHEPNPQLFVKHLADIFDQVKRVMKDTGTLWLNLGDSYAGTNQKGEGLKPKDLVGIPWMVAFELRQRGWWLRSDVIWHKGHPTPEPQVKDRPIKSHEHIFLFTKSDKYHFNISKQKIIQRGFLFTESKNIVLEDVWKISPQHQGGHPATFPEDLVKRCLVAGCPERGMVLDPFVGSGTVVKVATMLGLNSIGIDLNPDSKLVEQRMKSGILKGG